MTTQPVRPDCGWLMAGFLMGIGALSIPIVFAIIGTILSVILVGGLGAIGSATGVGG